MPKSAWYLLFATLVGLALLALVTLRGAYDSGIRSGDLRQLDIKVLGLSLAVALVFAVSLHILARRNRTSREERWRRAWPAQLRRIEFYGDHEFVQRELAYFAHAVGAEFHAFASPPDNAAREALAVWHLGRSPVLGFATTLSARAVVILATSSVAAQLKQSHPQWVVVTYPFLLRTLLGRLPGIASAALAQPSAT